MKNSISRRNFIRTAGLSLAGAVVLCSGLGYAASLPPAIQTPEHTYGKESSMNKRILVTYATCAGSTVEVATAIAETLAKRGFSVDVKAVKTRPALSGYDALVMGSAIRMGAWLPEAVSFIKDNQAALSGLPLALFTVHMSNLADDETSRAARADYTAPLKAFVTPKDEAFFAGVMDYTKLSFLDGLIAKAVASQSHGPTGDQRDWSKISAWAQAVMA